MDQDVARNKLSSLERCIQRIRSRLPESHTALASDLDAQDIISVNLQRAVQLCVDLSLMIVADKGLPYPSDMAESFERLHDQGWISDATYAAMRAAVGFRNISVHEYRKLDWQIVHGIASHRLDDFRAFARELTLAGIVEI